MGLTLIATRESDYRTWDYLIGDFHRSRSVGLDRYNHLRELNERSKNTMKIALYDRTSDAFTKWVPWYGTKGEDKIFRNYLDLLQTAYDVHRSVLENEVVIESDYKTYEENAKAAHVICAVLESKGFVPHIYYSGSKSVHIHTYLSWESLFSMDEYLQARIIELHATPEKFKAQFMEWLRSQMITCFGTNARTFDEQLISAKHLIRAELSKNKLGFKTFLGYNHKDIPPFPVIANENTKILPEIGAIIESKPSLIQDLVEEYLQTIDAKSRKVKAKRREQSLREFFAPPEQVDGIKGCAAFLLTDEFAKLGDGRRNASYILTNELRRVKGDAALPDVLRWNEKLGFPVPEQDVRYRFAQPIVYKLSHEYIHTFLEQLGVKGVDEICRNQRQQSTKQS